MNVQDPSRFEARAGHPGLVPGYMSGFGNSFETEALAGALPIGRNSPQKVKYGLYAEQLSGSPFTAPQDSNQRSWLYRIRPTVKHSARYRKVDKGLMRELDMPVQQAFKLVVTMGIAKEPEILTTTAKLSPAMAVTLLMPQMSCSPTPFESTRP